MSHASPLDEPRSPRSTVPGLETAAEALAGERDRAEPAERAARLLAGTPREILARIVPGDPLQIRPRVAGRVRGRALLLDTDRVLVRALALCARQADRWRGRPALEAWLEACVDQAIDDLLAEAPGGGTAAELPQPGVFELLAEPLGLDPPGMRQACARFNRLDEPVRRAFFALVLEGRDLDALARAAGVSATEVARRARRGLDVFLANSPDPPPPA